MGTWGVGRLAEGGSCVVWRLSDRYSEMLSLGSEWRGWSAVPRRVTVLVGSIDVGILGLELVPIP